MTMAVNDFVFTRNALNRWEGKFNSSGSRVTVQVRRAVERDKVVYLVVYANLHGMKPVAIYTVSNGMEDIIFDVDVAEGVEVTVESNSEVLDAKIMG